jgi:hypothetical protein
MPTGDRNRAGKRYKGKRADTPYCGRGPKRDDLDMEADLEFLGALVFQRYPAVQRDTIYNERQYERAFERAKRAGCDDAEAQRKGEEAKLGRNTIAADVARLKRELAKGTRAVGEKLVRQHIAALELERQRLEFTAHQAWLAWGRSQGPEIVTRTEEGPPNNGSGMPLLKQTTTETPSIGDPRFLAEARQCTVAIVEVMTKQLELACLLSISAPVDLSELRSGAGREVVDRVRVEALERLFRIEARVLGRQVDGERLKLLTAIAGAGRSDGEGGDAPEVIEVVGVTVNSPGPLGRPPGD